MSVSTERQEQAHSQLGLDALLWGVVAALLIPVAVALASLPWARALPAWILPATIIAGLAIGGLLALLRVSPRFWWASLAAAPLLGAAIAAGAYLTARSAPGATLSTGTLGLGAYVTLLSAALPWLIFRVKQAWLALVIVWVSVAGVWHAALAPQQVWWLLVLLVLSLLLLGLCHLREEVRVWRAADLQRLGPVLWPSARAIMGLSLLVALVGLVPLAAQLGLLSQAWRSSALGQSGPLPFDSANGTPVAVLGAPLSLGAPDVSSTQVVLTYDILSAPALPAQPNSPQSSGSPPAAPDATPSVGFLGTPPLLGATLDTFDGSSWVQGAPTTSVPVAHALQLPAGSLTMQARITLRNPPRMENGSFLLGFDQPLGFSLPAEARVIDGADPTPLSVAAWQTSAPLASGITYTTTAAVPPDAATVIGSLSPALQTRLTKTPSGLTEQLRTLAKSWIDTSQSPAAQAAALLDALQAHMTLDPQAAPPAGVDGVSWFLQGKRGSVLLFTTTYILLGRSIGLPLRLAEGYLPGTYDNASQKWVVRGSDATVWAQLAIPGVGWLDFFPASSEIKVTVPSKIIYSGTPPAPTPTPPTSHSSSNPQRPVTRTPLQDQGGIHSVLVIGGVVLLILLLLVALLLALLRQRWAQVGARLGPLAQFFARVALLAQLAGIRLRASDTATQATAKVTAYLPEQSAALVELNSVYERMRYGPPGGLLANLQATVREQWLRVRGALVRLVVTRPWRRPPKSVPTSARGRGETNGAEQVGAEKVGARR